MNKKTASNPSKNFDFDNSLFFGLKERMTEEQEAYVRSLLDPATRLVVVNASAGTGKSTLAVAAAKILVNAGKYHSLFYTFAPVEEGQMGYTPGDVFEKEQKYHGPLLDALEAIDEDPMQCLYNPLDLAAMKKNADKIWVTAASHTFLRGTNLSNRIIIIDEAQNFTTSQLRKILTRCHDNCKVVLIGHTGQCDIKPSASGFASYIEHAKTYPFAKTLCLTHNFRGTLANWADQI